MPDSELCGVNAWGWGGQFGWIGLGEGCAIDRQSIRYQLGLSLRVTSMWAIDIDIDKLRPVQGIQLGEENGVWEGSKGKYRKMVEE